ncbi:hypothetical protein HMN09_00815000 [Mycena chlorophos]|uniref:Uncharacterized protein n=1 Tax=Mycena chlorophos TaxID=658473 RepID=A0A8H6SUB2_MYCCL|nr:hypothetical protein HMN09_00815000 [Mycena chlorophos]
MSGAPSPSGSGGNNGLKRPSPTEASPANGESSAKRPRPSDPHPPLTTPVPTRPGPPPLIPIGQIPPVVSGPGRPVLNQPPGPYADSVVVKNYLFATGALNAQASTQSASFGGGGPATTIRTAIPSSTAPGTSISGSRASSSLSPSTTTVGLPPVSTQPPVGTQSVSGASKPKTSRKPSAPSILPSTKKRNEAEINKLKAEVARLSEELRRKEREREEPAPPPRPASAGTIPGEDDGYDDRMAVEPEVPTNSAATSSVSANTPSGSRVLPHNFDEWVSNDRGREVLRLKEQLGLLEAKMVEQQNAAQEQMQQSQLAVAGLLNTIAQHRDQLAAAAADRQARTDLEATVADLRTQLQRAQEQAAVPAPAPTSAQDNENAPNQDLVDDLILRTQLLHAENTDLKSTQEALQLESARQGGIVDEVNRLVRAFAFPANINANAPLEFGDDAAQNVGKVLTVLRDALEANERLGQVQVQFEQAQRVVEVERARVGELEGQLRGLRDEQARQAQGPSNGNGNEVAALRAQIAAMERDSQEAMNEVLEGNTELQQQNTQLEDRNKHFLETLSERDQELRDAQAELATLSGTIRTLQAELERSKGVVSQREQELAAARQQLLGTNANAELERLRNVVSHNDVVLAQERVESTRVRMVISRRESELEDARKDLVQLQARVNEFGVALATKAMEVADLTRKLDASTQASAVGDATVQDLRRQVEALEEEKQRIVGEGQRMALELHNAQAAEEKATAEMRNTEFETIKLADRVKQLEGENHTLAGQARDTSVTLDELRNDVSSLREDNRLQAAQLEDLRNRPTTPRPSSVSSSRFRILDAEFATNHLVQLVMHEHAGGGRELSHASWARILRQLQYAASRGGRSFAAAPVDEGDVEATVIALQNYYLQWLVHDEEALAHEHAHLPVRLVPQYAWVNLPADGAFPVRQHRYQQPLDPWQVPTPPRLTPAHLTEIFFHHSLTDDVLECNECGINGFGFALPTSTSLERLAEHVERYHRESVEIVLEETKGMTGEEMKTWFLAGETPESIQIN